jgi:hypothetical protein
LEIESLLHLEPPAGCHGYLTSATQLCSDGHWLWYPPSYHWFCTLPAVPFHSPRIVSHSSAKGTLIQKAG